MTKTPSKGIQMLLPANAENVSLVRHAIAGTAESLGMGEVAIADLKTVVTEACMNVVQHAYGGDGGPMEVLAWPEDDEFVVVVADSGDGIRPQAESADGSLRLGLSLIASMSRDFEIAGSMGSGTRVTMRLALNGGGGDGSDVDTAATGSAGATEQVGLLDGNDPDGVTLTAWDLQTLTPVLARVVSVLASRKDLSVDQLSDAVLFSDAITGDIARMAPVDPIRLRLNESGEGVGLEVGPLAVGDAEKLRDGFSLPGNLGGSLESLTEEVSVVAEDGAEYLRVRFGAPDVGS